MKRTVYRSFANVFSGSKFCIPHPEKMHKGGEDGMLLQRRVMAVADGVGGWIRAGVDPGEYSKFLIGAIEKHSTKSEESTLDGVKLMRKAYNDAKRITGSSTCCLATLRDAASSSDSDSLSLSELAISNLGDSGALIYRPVACPPEPENEPEEKRTDAKGTLFGGKGLARKKSRDDREREAAKAALRQVEIGVTDETGGKLLFKTDEQCHDFNFPKQLGTNSEDIPEHSDVTKIAVKEGDLVFLATDGVFDNLFEEDIISIIRDERLTLEERNVQLVKTAFQHSLDPTYESPFSVREKEWVRQRFGVLRSRPRSFMRTFVGGKSDDITAVLAVVTDEKNVKA